MASLFHTYLYEPLYNTLIFILGLVPGGDVGIAVVLLTVLVRILILPLSISSVKTQYLMREMEPKLKELNEKFKENWQERALKTQALYKEYKVRPFSSFLLLLIQLPIIIALYTVFWKGGLPSINIEDLYSFVRIPEAVDMHFLGLFDMSSRSLILAIMAGAAQFAQATIALPPAPEPGSTSFKDEFARAMRFQMRFVFPVVIAGFAYVTSAVVALYWLVGSLAMLVQDILLKRTFKKKKEASQ